MNTPTKLNPALHSTYRQTIFAAAPSTDIDPNAFESYLILYDADLFLIASEVGIC